MTAPNWTQAACIDHEPELWFPSDPGRCGDAWDEPRAICSTCPIRDACLEWALETGQVD
jgi:WhiB family redox-sensing transcriptional regulator